jgi:hypothetical protein
VLEWHKKFPEGREDVEPGRLVTMKTEENVENVSTLTGTDRSLDARMIAQDLNLGK